MISTEFHSVVSARNLLRTRIMLKDSMVVDPTFAQFDEMLLYAHKFMPEIIVAYDGEALENDFSKWNYEQMNMELVQLVGNFSEQRIIHLRRVIGIVLAEEIRKSIARGQENFGQNGYASSTTASTDKQQARRHALHFIASAGSTIESTMKKVKEKGSWSTSDIDAMEAAAKRILDGVRKYKANR